MTIPVELIAVFLSAWLAVNGWVISQLISLQRKVAVIMASCQGCNTRENNQHQSKHMKKHPFRFDTIILCALLAFAVPAPARAMSLLFHRETVTNYVPIYSAVTNADGITALISNTVAKAQTTVTIAPGVQSAINTGEAIAAVAPPPYGGIAAAVLALIAAGLGTAAKIATNRANTTASALTATIAGVEAVGDAATKAMIQSHAVAAGVQDTLHPAVQSVSAAMPQFTAKAAPPAVPLAQALATMPTVTKV